jgi:hypothetical protein
VDYCIAWTCLAHGMGILDRADWKVWVCSLKRLWKGKFGSACCLQVTTTHEFPSLWLVIHGLVVGCEVMIQVS